MIKCLRLRTVQDCCKKGWDKAGSRAQNFLSFLQSIKENISSVKASKLPNQAKLSFCTSFTKTFFLFYFNPWRSYLAVKHFKYKLSVVEIDRPAHNYSISFNPAVSMHNHEKSLMVWLPISLRNHSAKIDRFFLNGNLLQHICIKILKPISKVF